jgi:serine protease Do
LFKHRFDYRHSLDIFANYYSIVNKKKERDTMTSENDYTYNNNTMSGTDPLQNQQPTGAAPQQPQQGSGFYHYSAAPGSQPTPDSQQPYQGQQSYQGQQAYNTQPTSGGYTQSGYGAPQNGTPNYNPPMSGYHVTPEPPKKQKKSGGAKTVAAVALVCVLAGGLCGGAVATMLNRNTTNVTEAPVEDEASTEESAAETEEPTVFKTSTIDVKTNSTTTNMTPQDVYENYVNAVVAISNEGTTTNIFGQVSATASSGSGMIISEDGYILTNNHVVEDAQTLTVTMTSGEEYDATIIGTDSENDVALIKIDATDLPTVSIGDSDSIQVGEQLCAIGNPLGELTNTLTVGYVSALDREINENGTPINMFQTDCAINSGNSGGPIFDMNGNVVGITTAKYSTSSYSSSASIEGIGFCIPINDAMGIVDDLMQYGYVRGRVSMGITCQAISSTVTQYYNLPTGIYVNSVTEGSAAENAGLQQGDIICALDGTEITSVTDLKALLKSYSPGDTATLTVYKSETRTTEDVEITFDEMVTTTSTETTEEETTEDQNTQQGTQQMIPINPFG